MSVFNTLAVGALFSLHRWENMLCSGHVVDLDPSLLDEFGDEGT